MIDIGIYDGTYSSGTLLNLRVSVTCVNSLIAQRTLASETPLVLSVSTIISNVSSVIVVLCSGAGH